MPLREAANFEAEPTSPKTPDEQERQTRLEAIAAEIEAVLGTAIMRVAALVAEAHEIHRYQHGDGGFEGWVERRLKMSRRTAYNLLDVHKRFGDQSVQILHTLPRSVLYLIAPDSVPEAARTEVMERTQDGEKLSHAQVKEIITGHKRKSPAYNKKRKPPDHAQASSELANEPTLSESHSLTPETAPERKIEAASPAEQKRDVAPPVARTDPAPSPDGIASLVDKTKMPTAAGIIIANEEPKALESVPSPGPIILSAAADFDCVDRGIDPKPLGSAILVFNRTDDGNVKPKRVIQGPATKLEDNQGVTVDDKEIAVPNRDNSILIFPRLGNGNIAPLRQITYLAGNKDLATGVWLGPWGEGSSIQLGPAIWFDHKGTGDQGDDEIVVRARYAVRDPATTRTITQYVIAFFPRNANGPTIPTRIIASKELTGDHQVTVVGDEVLSAVQGNRAGNPPVFGGLAVYDATQSNTLNPDGRTLSDVPVKRLLRAGDLQGGLSGVRHPRAVAMDPVRREVYLGDSKGNDIRVFRVDWQNEPCLSEAAAPTPPQSHGHEDHQLSRAASPAVGSPAALGRPDIFGVGTELIDTPKGPNGVPFDLTSIFAFTSDFFHCVVLTNDQAFMMPTHSLGLVEIGRNQFSMSVDSVGIGGLTMTGAGRVEFKGTARSITRVGDKFEEAIVPFNVVAVDGGPGFERDSLLLTVFYNEKDSPMQLAIFGPEAHFGHSILSGDIAIARK